MRHPALGRPRGRARRGRDPDRVPRGRGVLDGGPRVTDRADILGCPIDRLGMADTLAAIERAIAAGRYTQHMAINAAKLVAMHDDRKLCADRRRLRTGERRRPERGLGFQVARAIRFPSASRASTSCRRCSSSRSTAVIGSTFWALAPTCSSVPCSACRRDTRGYRWPEHGTAISPMTRSREVCDAIRASRADVLFVAMSSPRKEYFLGEYGPDLGVPFVMGVGGSVDVIAGMTGARPRPGSAWVSSGCSACSRSRDGCSAAMRSPMRDSSPLSASRCLSGHGAQPRRAQGELT